MSFRRVLLVAPAAPVLALLVASCGETQSVDIGLVMREPAGLLDQATSVDLFVFDAGLANCDTATGHIDKIPQTAQRFPLDHAGCPGGGAWCKTISLDRDGSTKLFGVQARSAAGIIAEGCTKATIDQDPLQVDIKVQRFNPPACCNDGQLQVGEQCEGQTADTTCDGSPGGQCLGIIPDDVCECDCLAKEILVSITDTAQPRLSDGPPNSQTNLAMTFAPGNAKIGTALRMVFLNAASDELSHPPLGGTDISVRFLKPDLYPIISPYPLEFQLQLPLLCASPQGPGLQRHQTAPAISVASADTVAIVYGSDEVVASRHDIYLTPTNVDGCMDAHSCTNDTDCQTLHCDFGYCRRAVMISQPATSMPGSDDAHVAKGPEGSVLAVWTRDGHVYGRIWKTTGELLPATAEIDVATNAAHPRVAGNSSGWNVVYSGSGGGDGDAVLMRPVDAMGSLGTEIRVNAVTSDVQDQPDVAMLEDGRTMVVFRSADDIFFQRFDASGTMITSDQDQPLNTVTDGAQQNPAVAAAVGVADFFAVAWETTDTADISARFVGGSTGFLFNSVTGQNDEFKATHPGIAGQRTSPALAIGGGGFVVIGWQDAAPDHSGLFVRRFPLPTSQ